jgi:hypothetical protein
MDPATLTAFLTPFLPVLLKFGNQAATTAVTKASEAAGNQFTESALKKAKAVWEKLHPKIQAKAAAQEAIEDAAKAPDDADLQAALRVQIKKILDADAELAAAIAQILQEESPDRASGTHINQNVTGNQNQVIGQVSGGHVIGNFTGNFPGNAASPPDSDKTKAIDCKTILILAANPRDTASLRLDHEARNLQAALDTAPHSDRFELKQRWAVSVDDVRRALFRYSPYIAHFSGHGVGSSRSPQASEVSRKLVSITEAATGEGLVFENEYGKSHIVSSEAIAQLFGLFAGKIECVVLNACYSSTQAKAIARHIPYVIGMSQAIGDRAAIQFTKGFYDAIFAGESIEVAYRSGCNAIQTENIPEHLTPVIEKPD